MTTFFISDVHLDKTRPAVARALFRWLEGIRAQTEALYILGDFFDVWVGDDDDNPFNLDVVHHLRTFSDSGVPLYVMHGNRDFLLGERFAAAAGARLLPDPIVVDLYGEAVLLMHGDSLCTRDEEYMAFRRQARDPEWQARLLAQPLQQRRAFAHQAREKSQAHNSLKAEDIMDVTPAEVLRVLEEHRVQRLIHGHTHRPARHRFEANGAGAERIVLGDWENQGWCLRVSPAGFELQNWDIPMR